MITKFIVINFLKKKKRISINMNKLKRNTFNTNIFKTNNDKVYFYEQV